MTPVLNKLNCYETCHKNTSISIKYIKQKFVVLTYDQTKDIQVTKTIARHSAASTTQDIYVDEGIEIIAEQYNKVNY